MSTEFAKQQHHPLQKDVWKLLSSVFWGKWAVSEFFQSNNGQFHVLVFFLPSLLMDSAVIVQFPDSDYDSWLQKSWGSTGREHISHKTPKLYSPATVKSFIIKRQNPQMTSDDCFKQVPKVFVSPQFLQFSPQKKPHTSHENLQLSRQFLRTRPRSFTINNQELNYTKSWREKCEKGKIHLDSISDATARPFRQHEIILFQFLRQRIQYWTGIKKKKNFMYTKGLLVRKCGVTARPPLSRLIWWRSPVSG